MYQSEFPVDTPVPVFDPTLLAGIALVLLAVALLTYFAGKHVGGRGRDERWRDVPKTIHDAIKAKCVAAASAPSGELFYKAQDLVEEVERRMGPVLTFGGPCHEALRSVTEALKAEPVVDKSKDKAKPAQGGHRGDKLGHEESPAVQNVAQKSERELAAANVTILGGRTLVLTGHHPAHEPDHDHQATPETPKVLDHRDYSRQVRMAVVEFSDFWSRGDCLNELQRCQAALTRTEPFKLAHKGADEL